MVTTRILLIVLSVGLAVSSCSTQQQPPPSSPSAPVTDQLRLDELVSSLAAPLVDDQWVAGLAIGLITPQGISTYGLGRTDMDGSSPPSAETIFEIGSVTKVFTSLLLASMVVEGLVSLDTPVVELLPDGMTVPESVGAITVAQLATHTSGLPRMPTNFEPADPADPYADYTEELLFSYLEEATLGEGSYAYSNLAVGLLGTLLARRLGMSYEEALRLRITEPLSLDATIVAGLSPPDDPQLAQTTSGDMAPVPQWRFDTLAPCGALRSTLTDMLSFLSAQMAAHEGEPVAGLGPSMALTHGALHPAPPIGQIALGWHLSDAGLIWHNGGTHGSHSFVGFDPAQGIGVVVLSNTGTALIDELALALARAVQTGEASALDLPPLADVPVDELRRLIGTYRIAPEATVEVFLDDENHLQARVTSQPAFRLYPQSATRFSYRVAAAEVTFHLPEGSDGPAEALTIHQGGADTRAGREPAAEALDEVPPEGDTPKR